MSGRLYAYYGDDFTGSTDVLESLTLGGVESVLFIGPPSREHLAKFPDRRAIGIAGDSRSQSPEWMSANLPVIFEALKSFNARVAQYKTCSTFDSSPTHGSIGRAMEIGGEVFAPKFIPIVVGAPHLGRYVVFGNLFAAAAGKIYRIDEHPTMRCHPVTPMTQADLRKHLALQTAMPIGLVNLLSLRENAGAALTVERDGGAKAVLFDGLDEESLATTGKLLWSSATEQPLFGVGSSGLTESLIAEWHAEGIARPRHETQNVPVEQVLVLSGSCSPATEAQIRWGLANGFAGVAIDPARLIDSTSKTAAVQEASRQCLAELAKGRSVILYTALGPLKSGTQPHGEYLGKELGRLLKSLLSESAVRRVIICGGDTSSHAMQQLGLYALTWSASVEAGAPLCRAHTDDAAFRDLELVLKGGQVGKEDFFALARSGGRAIRQASDQDAAAEEGSSDRNPAVQSTREKISAAISTMPAITRKGGL